MLWRPLKKYIISTFSLQIVLIYYIDLHSGFVFLLLYEYSNGKFVFFSGQKISKWFTHELLDKKTALNLCKSKDGNGSVCECVNRCCIKYSDPAMDRHFRHDDFNDDFNLSTCKCWSRAEWRYKLNTESNGWVRSRKWLLWLKTVNENKFYELQCFLVLLIIDLTVLVFFL